MTLHSWALESYLNTPYVYIDDMFTDDELNDIITIGENSGLREATVATYGLDNNSYGQENSLIKNNRNAQLSFLDSNDVENSWLFKRLSQLIYDANQKFFKFDLDFLELIQYAKYEVGGVHKTHMDLLEKSVLGVRKLSLILQLSGPSEYEGGDIILYSSGSGEKMSRGRGRILIFPSYTLHEVTPITKGIRRSLVCWTIGKPFK